MAGDRVLPRRGFGHAAVRGGWPAGVVQLRHETPESEQTQSGNAQPHGPRNVAQRVASLISVSRRVGQLADADAIEDDENDAGKYRWGQG